MKHKTFGGDRSTTDIEKIYVIYKKVRISVIHNDITSEDVDAIGYK